MDNIVIGRNKRRPAQPKWTMSDVARLAEVSVKTVSRVLNQEPAVHDATRRRILRLMEDLGYQPHSAARSLRGRAPNCVGIACGAPPDEVPLSEELLGWLFRRLYELFGTRGDYVCFDFNPYVYSATRDYARGLWERLYRGIVVTGPLALEDSVLARVHASGQPYLALGRLPGLPELSSATVDFDEGAYLATRHLVERGHKRIALLMSLDGYSPGEERRQGYRRALDEAGIPFDPQLVHSVRFSPDSVTHGTHRLLINGGVTALVDSSGTQDAQSIREGFRRAGRRPGPDGDIVAWTYACDATVLSEACAHVWIPVREALATGLIEFAEWLNGTRDDPISILYRPILQTGPKLEEIHKPRLVFTVRE